MYNIWLDAARASWVCFDEYRNQIIDKYILHSLIQIYCSELYLFILQLFTIIWNSFYYFTTRFSQGLLSLLLLSVCIGKWFTTSCSMKLIFSLMEIYGARPTEAQSTSFLSKKDFQNVFVHLLKNERKRRGRTSCRADEVNRRDPARFVCTEIVRLPVAHPFNLNRRRFAIAFSRCAARP